MNQTEILYQQIQVLEQQSLAAISQVYNFQATNYCASGSWGFSIVANLALGTFVYLLSIATTEYSWIDRVWSILPTLAHLHILYYQHACEHIPISTRQYIMFGLVALWGLRLTYNYWRKGGYAKGGQDYRWIHIRKNYPRIVVELLNFVFTSYYQPFLIYLFASPIKYAYQGELNTFDYALVALWVALWLGEVVADEQQWAFQTKKYEYLNQGKKINQIPKPYSEGFITSGLFKISRHPNFFCEISLWWVIFAFSFNSYGLNICVLGAVLLNLLFLGSTSLTEQISCAKYPKYLEYQKQVSRLVPFMIIPSGSVKGDKEN